MGNLPMCHRPPLRTLTDATDSPFPSLHIGAEITKGWLDHESILMRNSDLYSENSPCEKRYARYFVTKWIIKWMRLYKRQFYPYRKKRLDYRRRPSSYLGPGCAVFLFLRPPPRCFSIYPYLFLYVSFSSFSTIHPSVSRSHPFAPLIPCDWQGG